MKKFVIIGIAVILAGITALAAMSKFSTGNVTHVTSETTWFNEDHSAIRDITTSDYTVKTSNGDSIRFNNGVLETIDKG